MTHSHIQLALDDDASLAPVDRLPAPNHVAIIMDGNGRWATYRTLPRLEGHRRGVEALRKTVRAALDLRIRYLTVYSFSLENWARPQDEIFGLMALLKRFIRNDLAELRENGVRVRVLGQREGLSADVLSLLDEAEETTRRNSRLTLVIAFNYGGRQEIAAAARALAERVAAGEIASSEIDADLLGRFLSLPDVPDPDLVIRTSGEMRVSNFLLWQAAYAEYVFLPVLWPDFDRAALETALREFARRERRFGGVAAPALKTASS